jgi:hypothetical protein
VYRTKARFVIAFASGSYGTKAWPTLERQSAQARGMQEVGSYLLPVRLDDSDLPGILPTVGYVDARVLGLDRFVELVLQKLGREGRRDRDDPVPLTQAETEVLKRERPPAWEYYLFAGQILQGRAALEDSWRDHVLGLKQRTTQHVAGKAEVSAYISRAMDDLRTTVGNLDLILTQEAQTAAFGAPGTPGDWDMIMYMGTRFVGLYEQLLLWAAEIRSLSVPDDWATCFGFLSKYCDQPIQAVRDAVGAYVSFARSLPDHFAHPEREPLHLNLLVKFELDPAISAGVVTEIQNHS